VKSVECSELETFRTADREHFEFQLVNKQVDIPCDGILGRDFFLCTRAQVYYDSQSVKVGKDMLKMVNATTQRAELKKVEQNREITLPQRSERIIKILIEQNSQMVGIVRKQEIQERVSLAEALTKAVEGHIMTSILIMNKNEVEI
jgi:hypothetical protein